MYGGQVHVPMVVRSMIGKSWGQGAQHSQGLYSFFMHVPGLKVVAPTNPYDAKGCLVAAIRDDDPVMLRRAPLLHSAQGTGARGALRGGAGPRARRGPGRRRDARRHLAHAASSACGRRRYSRPWVSAPR